MTGLPRRAVRAVRRRLGEIRPAPPRPAANLARTYQIALIGVALLSGLAWLNDASRAATGTLIALVLGLLWVAWVAHRTVIAIGLAIFWWVATAPVMGLLAAAGAAGRDVQAPVTRAATATVGLGVVVWLAALFGRAPRPAATIMISWLVNFAVVLAATPVVPEYGWSIGYAVTVIVLVWRAGLPVGGRIRRTPPDSDDPARAAVDAAVRGLPGGYAARWAARLGGAHAVAVVTGPTGTYAITGHLPRGEVRTVSHGTRLQAGDRRLDVPVRAAARTARRVARKLRTAVQPVLLIDGVDFPAGLVRAAPVAGREAGAEVLVIRADLLVDRITFGSAVLTGSQVRRVARRFRRLAAPAASGEKPVKVRRAERATRVEPVA